MSPPDTARISPTAHYTGHVWERAGLSHPALAGIPDRTLFQLARPLMWVGSAFSGGLTLEDILLQRHRIIDALLTEAIERDGITQVIELAGGLSGRGLRFTARYPQLRYLEGDLPDMVARKQAAADAAGASSPRHRIAHINALLDDGPTSIGAVAPAWLDTTRPVVVITEGLINYFDTPTIAAMWARFARLLRDFGGGLYLSDIRLNEAATGFAAVRVFLRLLSMIARGRVHSHFSSGSDAIAALQAAGFSSAALHQPADWADRVQLKVGRRGAIIQVLAARSTG